MLRTCSVLLGRWNSRDFLKSRSKFSGAVHTRHVLGCRGRYQRWSSKYTLRDGQRHVNNHLKRGLGIKLGGGLFGLRIPRQVALSTMTRAEYELEMYGHPNITNPYRECLHTHPTLQAVMSNASLSLHLVVLLPRIARSTLRTAIHEYKNNTNNAEDDNVHKGNNSSVSQSIDHEVINAFSKDRLHPLWDAVMKEAVASVNSLIAHHTSDDDTNDESMTIEICFATLERSISIHVTHAIDEAALYNSLRSLEQEHYKGRILHKYNTRNSIQDSTNTLIKSYALMKERQRAIPLFGKHLCLPQRPHCAKIEEKPRSCSVSNVDGNRVNCSTSYLSSMKNNMSSIGVECLIRNLRTSLSNALCACVMMNDSVGTFNPNSTSINTDHTNEETHSVKEAKPSKEAHAQVDKQNQYVRKRPLFFAFPSSRHYSDTVGEVDQQSSATNKTCNTSNNNEEETEDIQSGKSHYTNSENSNCRNDASINANEENSSVVNSKVQQPERRLLKDDIDTDLLNGVWALPKSTLHKLLSWHYCNQDPRAHSADAIPHDKRTMHFLLFIDASKCQSTSCTTSNNNNSNNYESNVKQYMTRHRITKSLISQNFTQELERMGFKPLQSTTLYATAVELKEWLLLQKRQQELLKQFQETCKVELYVPLLEQKNMEYENA